jgi:hypothetical protein
LNTVPRLVRADPDFDVGWQDFQQFSHVGGVPADVVNVPDIARPMPLVVHGGANVTEDIARCDILGQIDKNCVLGDCLYGHVDL